MANPPTTAAQFASRIRQAVVGSATNKQKADALAEVTDELFRQVRLVESASPRVGSVHVAEDLLDDLDSELGVESGTFRQLRESSIKNQLVYQQSLMSLVNSLTFK